ncbi:hypothetical protein LguiA_002717 [Lonicera macranthoides]
MICGCAKAGRLDRALSLFNEMKYAGINLDRVSYNTLLTIYASLGGFGVLDMVVILSNRQHGEALNVGKEMESIGIKKDVVTYNALLDGFGKQGMYDKVKELFEKMKSENLSPNLLTYSTLISVYSKGGLVESSALLLDEMTKKGIQPNVVTYNSIINAFGQSIGFEFAGDVEPHIRTSPLLAIKDATEKKVEHIEEDRIIKIFEQLADEKSCHTKKDSRYKQGFFASWEFSKDARDGNKTQRRYIFRYFECLQSQLNMETESIKDTNLQILELHPYLLTGDL